MLYFWNNGSPRKARVSGSGNRQRLVNADGSISMGNIQPDPDSDLFAYEEAGDRPGEFQREAGFSYANDGWKITATRQVADIPLDQSKQRHKQKIKQHRDAAMNGGMAWAWTVEVETDPGDPSATPPVAPTVVSETTTYLVQTDADSRREMTGAVVAIDQAALAEQAWRMADNSLVVLTSEQFIAMALAVRGHINAAYLRQAVLEATLDAASDVDAVRAIDVTTGWPANLEL